MTPEYVAARVRVIGELAGDAEAAHSAEDVLYRAVLGAIARGDCDDPAGCAAAALTSLELKFARWYA